MKIMKILTSANFVLGVGVFLQLAILVSFILLRDCFLENPLAVFLVVVGASIIFMATHKYYMTLMGR